MDLTKVYLLLFFLQIGAKFLQCQEWTNEIQIPYGHGWDMGYGYGGGQAQGYPNYGGRQRNRMRSPSGGGRRRTPTSSYGNSNNDAKDGSPNELIEGLVKTQGALLKIKEGLAESISQKIKMGLLASSVLQKAKMEKLKFLLREKAEFQETFAPKPKDPKPTKAPEKGGWGAPPPKGRTNSVPNGWTISTPQGWTNSRPSWGWDGWGESISENSW